MLIFFNSHCYRIRCGLSLPNSLLWQVCYWRKIRSGLPTKKGPSLKSTSKVVCVIIPHASVH